MKKFIFVFGLVIIATLWAAASYMQQRGSALAAAATPGQPVTPTPPTPAPTPATPQAPGVPRPATPTAPGAKPEEQLRIVPDQATNSLIIYGTTQEFQNIKNILKDLDIIPRQVLMDVLVAEVTLADTQSFGVEYELFRLQHPSIFGQTFQSQAAFRAGATPTLASGATGFTQFANGVSGIIGRGNSVQAFITALATDSRVKVLSSPSVLATDNRPARIQVGSEIPVLTGQTSTFTGTATPLTSNAIQYRNTGVILTIIPQVNSLGLVHLQVKQEVSDVGAANFGSTGSPSFTTRDAETTAVVQDGETLAIGGIITERKDRERSGIPYLMNLPIVGRFFSVTTDTTNRTELVMLITPHVVRNREEARDVTQELKDKLSAIKNELERLNRDRLRERAKEIVQPPEPVRPDKKPPEPPAAAAPVAPQPPAPTPSRAPGTTPSTAPANPRPVPGQQVLSPVPTSNPSAVSVASIQGRSGAIPVTPEALRGEDHKTSFETSDGVGALLSAIEADTGKQTRDAVKSGAPIVAKPIVPSPPIAAKPESPKSAHVWVVQVASFGRETDAQLMANRLSARGYDAEVAAADVGGKKYFRVQVGHLATRDEARQLQKNLKSTEKIEESLIASK